MILRAAFVDVHIFLLDPLKNGRSFVLCVFFFVCFSSAWACLVHWHKLHINKSAPFSNGQQTQANLFESQILPDLIGILCKN